MQLTLNKQSALRAIRYLRSSPNSATRLESRTGILSPDPSPWSRWTVRSVKAALETLPFEAQAKHHYLAVPSKTSRSRHSAFTNTVYADCIPDGSFIDIGNGLAISCPELLFVEMAEALHPIDHLMLGHELCGSFSRDAMDPFNGAVQYNLKPLTSTKRIGDFIENARRIRGIDAARRSLRYLNDNAWSPVESTIAAFLRLPIDDLGYEMGNIVLNPDIPKAQDLPGAKESRIPDIMIEGSKVGINYDGFLHFDLKSIARAGIELGMNPGSSIPEIALRKSLIEVRAKLVDDVRRNRELASSDLKVIPVLKEDLYERHGLDRLVAAILDELEKETGENFEFQRRALRLEPLCDERQRKILSLLPGKHERNIETARFIGGLLLSPGCSEVIERIIEL